MSDEVGHLRRWLEDVLSQDAHIFFNRELRSIAEWQRAIDSLGFALTLASDQPLVGRAGHLPAWLDGREAGFECDTTGSVVELQETYPKFDFGGPWTGTMSFYIGTMTGCVGAWLAIAAWASATDGTSFDPQTGLVMNARATVQYAKDALADLPVWERRLKELEQHDFGKRLRRSQR